MFENPKACAGDTLEEPGGVRRDAALKLTAILAVALGLRLLFTYQVDTSPLEGLRRLVPGTDAEKYDYVARWVLTNGWFEKSADMSPFYPYAFLPLVYLVTEGSGAAAKPVGAGLALPEAGQTINGPPDLASTLQAGTRRGTLFQQPRSVLYAKYLQGFLDTATVFFIYLIAMRVYGRRAALFAALAAAVYAPFIVYQGQLLYECVLNFLLAAFFVVLTGAQGQISLKRAAVLGLLAGFAIATKPTVAVFLPLALVWAWKGSQPGPGRVRKIAAAAATAAAAIIAVLAPFTYRNYHATGMFVLVRGDHGYMLYMGNNPAATGAYANPGDADGLRLGAETASMTLTEKNRRYRDAALGFIAKNPVKELGLLWRKFRLFFEAAEIPNNLSVRLYRQTTFLRPACFATFGLVFPFAVVGFLFSGPRRGALFLAAQAAIYSGVIIAFVVVDRYRLAILPLVLPAAGFAAAELVFAMKTLDLRRTVAIAAPVAALAILVNWFDLSTAARQRFHPNGFVEKSARVTRIHDDSDYATPFAVRMAEGKTTVAKALVVTNPPNDITGATVAVQLAVGRPGVLTVELNDSVAFVSLPRQAKQWIRAEFPADAVKKRVNMIYLRADESLYAFVYADDIYHFGRSLYMPDGTYTLRDGFDRSSYLHDPALHIGGREFKIRLELARDAGAAAR